MAANEDLRIEVKHREIARELYGEGIRSWKHKKTEKALRSLQRAHELNPENPHIASYLGLILVHSGIKDRGFQLCRSAIAKRPYDEITLFNLGQAYLLSSRRNEARLAFIRGAKACDNSEPFIEELKKMGIRRKPPLRFLSRDHPLNRWLGRVTYRPSTV
jgi:Flp pilus assembly protein TadD